MHNQPYTEGQMSPDYNFLTGNVKDIKVHLIFDLLSFYSICTLNLWVRKQINLVGGLPQLLKGNCPLTLSSPCFMIVTR